MHAVTRRQVESYGNIVDNFGDLERSGFDLIKFLLCAFGSQVFGEQPNFLAQLETQRFLTFVLVLAASSTAVDVAPDPSANVRPGEVMTDELNSLCCSKVSSNWRVVAILEDFNTELVIRYVDEAIQE
ncbi:unnamed protein product [Sphagnum troendelagicum]|uniref:Uncharacterized protein n=1 Tax=Sphagnum troendelagicum TaxID=128251 RepID=A0ABP0U7N1_9BRYO